MKAVSRVENCPKSREKVVANDTVHHAETGHYAGEKKPMKGESLALPSLPEEEKEETKMAL